MEAIDLYKFLHDNHIEHMWGNGATTLLAWIHPLLVGDFGDMIQDFIEESPLECHLLSRGYLCVDLLPVCKYYEINPQKILKPAVSAA